MIRMLVTGACGVTSRSVVRSLNKSDLFKGKIEFIGTDICNLKYAPYEGLYEKLYYVPPFNAPEYRSIMQRIIDENRIECQSLSPSLRLCIGLSILLMLSSCVFLHCSARQF